MSKSHAAQTIKHQRVLSSSSSGRLVLWKASIYYLKQNYLGYGPQADRKLLSANVSNLFIYSMLCGGVISFASIFIFSIIIFVKSAKLIFVQKVQAHKEKFLVFSLLLIAFFGLRSLTEISFGIFGIDMVVFFLAYNILQYNKLKT